MIAPQKTIRLLAHPKKAMHASRFFKTGKGEYGEGDVFLGLTVPESRTIAKQYRDLSLSDIEILLQSKYHEERLVALIILVERFRSGNSRERKIIFDFYSAHLDRVNNWDLVDISADKIVGAYLFGKSTRQLNRWIRSDILWERRVAMVASFWFIKEGNATLSFHLAEQLLNDKEDLMHKAAGWMLREAGKRVSKIALVKFLEKNARKMPRTMLRYAIEHFPAPERRRFLSLQ